MENYNNNIIGKHITAQETELNIEEQLDQMVQQTIAVTAADEVRVSERTTPKKCAEEQQQQQ